MRDFCAQIPGRFFHSCRVRRYAFYSVLAACVLAGAPTSARAQSGSEDGPPSLDTFSVSNKGDNVWKLEGTVMDYMQSQGVAVFIWGAAEGTVYTDAGNSFSFQFNFDASMGGGTVYMQACNAAGIWSDVAEIYVSSS